MGKTVFVSILSAAILFVAGAAAIIFTINRGGGFVPGGTITYVEDAIRLGDDARVIMRGRIVEKLGDETYMFKDSSGTMRVEIDNDTWRGQVVTPDDYVRLYGEVERNRRGVSIEVERIYKLTCPPPDPYANPYDAPNDVSYGATDTEPA